MIRTRSLTFPVVWSLVSVRRPARAVVVASLRRVEQHGLIGVGLDVFLQVLRTLEALAAKVALVRLQRNVDADVRGNVIAFHGRGAARAPEALEVEVVCRLATDVRLADVVLGVVSRGVRWSR